MWWVCFVYTRCRNAQLYTEVGNHELHSTTNSSAYEAAVDQMRKPTTWILSKLKANTNNFWCLQLQENYVLYANKHVCA